MAYVLLTEGGDDAWVFKNLCDRHHIMTNIKLDDPGLANSPIISIKKLGGIDNRLESLGVWLKDPRVERLGVVVDADTDLAGRWRELRRILIDMRYSPDRIPEAPDPRGTLITQESRIVPVIGVWVMPNNTGPGCLEDFIKLLMPKNDILWPRAIECVQQLPEQRFADHHRIKAHVRTWLAWQKEPGASMGLAITMGILLADTPPAAPVIAWLRQLFDLDSAVAP